MRNTNTEPREGSSMNTILKSGIVAATTAAIAAAVPGSSYKRVHDGFWHNGYIDPEGVFVGCNPIDHMRLAFRIVLGTGVIEGADPMKQLDRMGWIKVTADGFFWDRGPTEEQKQAMIGYLSERKIDRARFNDPRNTKTVIAARVEGVL